MIRPVGILDKITVRKNWFGGSPKKRHTHQGESRSPVRSWPSTLPIWERPALEQMLGHLANK